MMVVPNFLLSYAPKPNKPSVDDILHPVLYIALNCNSIMKKSTTITYTIETCGGVYICESESKDYDKN
jgi:hypothetical protein